MGVGAPPSPGQTQAPGRSAVNKKALGGETQKLIFFDKTRRTLIHWFHQSSGLDHPGMDFSEVPPNHLRRICFSRISHGEKHQKYLLAQVHAPTARRR